MDLEPHIAILQDLRLQTFDSIRFASYRTASKLRYVQKSTNLHLVDIWNAIEAFRENGLNILESQNEVSVARLESLVSSLYHNLNKRLPMAQQVPVDSKAGLLLNWLLTAYGNDNTRKIRVFSIKTALSIMCSGKLVDKLRYIFSQISDGAGLLVSWKLGEFLREVLTLPAAVYESPTFHYIEGLEEEIFPTGNRVTVNDFIAVFMSEPGPSFLVWLPLLHRLATVETIVHPTVCSVCHKENFTGFRYRCQRCHAYQLCQECFWHGKTSMSHHNDHEVKEYANYKSPSKQIGHSLRKSFRCVPEKPAQILPIFPDHPEKTLNLSHIVPPSPLPSHNGFPDPMTLHDNFSGSTGVTAVGNGYRSCTLDSRVTGRSFDSTTDDRATRILDASSNDEEHRLIARYAARLAQENRTGRDSNVEGIFPPASINSRAQRELIAQLEAKNKEIMQEISRLRRQQDTEHMSPENPALIQELRILRQRKGELEGHLGSLQDSRRHLMEQLEGLMRMLKNQQISSPRSTPNSSPHSGKLPAIPSNNCSFSNVPPSQMQRTQHPSFIGPHEINSSHINQNQKENFQHRGTETRSVVRSNDSTDSEPYVTKTADEIATSLQKLANEIDEGRECLEKALMASQEFPATGTCDLSQSTDQTPSFNFPINGSSEFDENFPALHEIGETIDELHIIMHAYIIKYCLSI